tara:strand:+ start:5664 stop:6080 length:417 start_codon:yes stop_codon:yes gene_type:complete
MSSYDATIAKVETSFTILNNQSYAKINISITNVSRVLSGLQFRYNTSASMNLATRDTHLEHYLTYINNGLYVASEPFQYFTVVHNPTTNIIAAIVSEQQYMSNEAILYLAIPSNSSFNISNVIVTNDQLPTQQYTLAS